MKLIGVSIRVSNGKHEDVCDQLKGCLKRIREVHPNPTPKNSEVQNSARSVR